ncbi:unnamed protein product [Protopolystoma xenopodis]|uniref:Uncharacterized protein n=1 Tax=Protopolystoma xenopodis TaxID=117903 RepID=A0A448WEV2_9PLAT|nr:unnamed protein product [Protopolystoma xenopodis]
MASNLSDGNQVTSSTFPPTSHRPVTTSSSPGLQVTFLLLSLSGLALRQICHIPICIISPRLRLSLPLSLTSTPSFLLSSSFVRSPSRLPQFLVFRYFNVPLYFSLYSTLSSLIAPLTLHSRFSYPTFLGFSDFGSSIFPLPLISISFSLSLSALGFRSRPRGGKIPSHLVVRPLF